VNEQFLKSFYKILNQYPDEIKDEIYPTLLTKRRLIKFICSLIPDFLKCQKRKDGRY